MQRFVRAGFVSAAILISQAVQASDTPLYQPAPAWIAPAPGPAVSGEDAPPVELIDWQHRIEEGRVWSYIHQKTRMVSPEMLSQAATLALPWAPDKGDLIVHDLAIVRGGQRIDLLAKGQRFTVLRREQSLEQRELTGILTATLAVEGLEVGDVLDMAVSITARDAALGGRVQDVVQLIPLPARIGPGRVRFSWPTGSAPRWKLLADAAAPVVTTNGGYSELTVAMPIVKPKDMPEDAPMRFRRAPMIEVASFADWADVSKVMAPLYATDGLIAPGSPLAAEVAAIQRAEATPIGRTQRALEVVQDKIRYLAVGMDGGNYVPQAPAKTWEVRYGDCKAKTLLLLAMLRAMGIEAEAVTANLGMGDLVPERLPSAAAFNHVFVKATLAGETLWLDGTGNGSRLADIRDTPAVGYVLPIRTAGAEPMLIETRANARPMIDMTIEADESLSVDLPSPFSVTAVLHGPMAAAMRQARAQLGPKEQRDAAQQFLQSWTGEGQFADLSILPDPATGDVTIRGIGVTSTPWALEDRRRRRTLDRTLASFQFAPDRSRPDWTKIPVASPAPMGLHFRTRVKLPQGGQGYTLDGTPDLDTRIANFAMKRSVRIADGAVTIDERVDSIGGEVPAARIATERDALATAKARVPQIVAPVDTPRRTTLTAQQIAQSSQVRAIRTTFDRAVAADVDEASGYVSRAAFEEGLGNRKAALADLTKVIATEPSVDLYLQRAGVAEAMGDRAAALADAERARALDPTSVAATARTAWLMADGGNLPGGIALLDERIALGGETRSNYRSEKAGLIGEFGDAAEAIRLYDTLIAEKPGSPLLMNARCWIKGTRSVMLDTALKDCTSSIELSDNTLAALDSRAMVWFRMGRLAEAMTDLDAVLAAAPDLASSRFLRGIVLKALHRDAEAATDLALARRISPTIDRQYARYGIKA